MKTPTIIAEVKTKSPFGFESERSWGELFEIAAEHGDWLSIHTDERWGGSFDLVEKAKKLTSKPILAKGIHETDDHLKKAIAAGADYVLTVRQAPPEIYQDQVLYEPFTIDELRLATGSTMKAVWNARDLRAKRIEDVEKTETFEQARLAFSGWLCQASLIETIDDVHPDADAVLVGQKLEKFVASL